MIQSFVRLAAVALVTMGVANTRAEAAFAAVEFTTGSGSASFSGGFVLGYQFLVTSTLNATDLGYYDEGKDGFLGAHTVGLYTESGTLLASTTLAAGTGDTLIGNYRYKAITPVTLTPGGYRVGGTPFGNDGYRFSVTGLTPAASISIVRGAYALSESLAFPNSTDGSPNLYAGASLRVDTASPAVATPLPPTLLAGFLGMAMLAGVRRLRRA